MASPDFSVVDSTSLSPQTPVTPTHPRVLVSSTGLQQVGREGSNRTLPLPLSDLEEVTASGLLLTLPRGQVAKTLAAL